YVSCDEQSNKVFVTGPPDKLATARKIMTEVDVGQPGQDEFKPGPMMLKTHSVPGGNAPDLAKMLQEMFRSSTSIRISAAGNTAIIVMAPAYEQVEIAKIIAEGGERGIVTEVIRVTGDATAVVGMLQKFFGDPKAGAPFLEAETNRNAVIVRGTTEQI